MRKCIRTMRSWLVERHGYSYKQAADAIVGYHSTIAEADKERLYSEFKKPDSKHRIFCGTDAISVGCNVRVVRNIGQVGMPKEFKINIAMQRFGRGGRDGKKALAVFNRGGVVWRTIVVRRRTFSY
jgi:superfamily II DNA helicase RecQ